MKIWPDFKTGEFVQEIIKAGLIGNEIISSYTEMPTIKSVSDLHHIMILKKEEYHIIKRYNTISAADIMYCIECGPGIHRNIKV